MKVRFLDEWGSKFEISGEINSSFTIGQGKTVTFAKNATFQGKEIIPNQVLHNESSASMTIGLSIKGNLVLVLAEPIIIKFEESELAELGEVLSEESEVEEEREKESQDEFYTDLKQMLDQYYSTKKSVSVLENELVKIQKKIPQIELLKIKAEEEEELLTLEFIEEDDTAFERNIGKVYMMYNNLEYNRLLLEKRKEKLETLLEKITTEVSSEEEREKTDDDELEEEIELEKDEFYTNLKQIFDLYYFTKKHASALEHDNKTLENKLIKMKKQLPPIEPQEEELLSSDFAEEDDTPFDSSIDRVYSKYNNLKFHINSLEVRRVQLEKITSETTFEEEIEDGYEADDEESETEDEESSIAQQAVSFAAELPLTAEDWETIPQAGALRRSETYFPVEISDPEEDVEASETPREHHPLIRSRRLSLEEWDDLFATSFVSEYPALNQTFDLLSEVTASTTEQATIGKDSDSSLFEDEVSEYSDSDNSLFSVIHYTPPLISEIEMATIQIAGNSEHSCEKNSFLYFTPNSTD